MASVMPAATIAGAIIRAVTGIVGDINALIKWNYADSYNFV